MKEIILKVLEEESNMQFNMNSASAREILTNKLLDRLEPFIQQQTAQLVEDIVLSSGDYVGEVHQ